MGKHAQQMQFTLTGFTQDSGCRVFAYDGVGEDRVRIKYTVSADLALSRKYGIRLQELPLMCLEILERTNAMDDIEVVSAEPVVTLRTLSFTEAAMIRYADEVVAARDAAALKRSSNRRQQPAKEAAAAAPGEFNPYSEAVPTPAKPYGQNW
jgi:hypothetical protein